MVFEPPYVGDIAMFLDRSNPANRGSVPFTIPLGWNCKSVRKMTQLGKMKPKGLQTDYGTVHFADLVHYYFFSS